MNLEDLAKKAIDEVSYEIKEQNKQDLSLNESVKIDQSKQSAEFVVEEAQEASKQNAAQELEEKIQKAKLEEEHKIYAKNEVEFDEAVSNDMVKNQHEDIFLKNLKERILVLFEGLNAAKDEDLQQRLELTITFLEFLLAKLEDKLKK